MMKPDQARELLGKLRSAKHQQARLDRVAKLPKPLAAVGLGVFGLLPTMKPPKEWPARRKLEAQSAAKLDADPKGRAKVLAALFPTLHVALEAGWKLRGTLPYTAGHNRRGFRAPHRQAMYASSRQTYLENVYDEVAQFPDDMLSPAWLAVALSNSSASATTTLRSATSLSLLTSTISEAWVPIFFSLKV